MNNGFLLIGGDSPTSVFESIMYDLYLYAPCGARQGGGRRMAREDDGGRGRRKRRRKEDAAKTEKRDGGRLHDTRAYDLDRNKSRLRPDFKAQDYKN